jgi:hypothetical protein
MESNEPVYTTMSETDATLCRAFLEDAGITVLEKPAGNAVVSANSPYALPPFIYTLFVRTQDVENARAIVAAYREEAENAHPAPDTDDTDAVADGERRRPAAFNRRWYMAFGMFWVWVAIIAFLITVIVAIFSHLHQLLPR